MWMQGFAFASFGDGLQKNQREALASCWAKECTVGYKTELKKLRDMGTFTLVPRPANARIIGTTWAHATKGAIGAEGTIFRPRLCAQGFSQVEGVDYDHSYSL